MSCPTCDHTMALLCNHEDMRYTSCERCGTIQVTLFGDPELHPPRVYVPKLVDRCRELQKAVWVGSIIFEELRRLGILESINRPEDRGYESVQL